MIDINFIKDMVFKTLNFEYNGEILTHPDECLSVEYDGKVCDIGYATEVQLARGLFLFAKSLDKSNESFCIKETPAFDTCGLMIDASRNAVPTVKYVEECMNNMACLGYNMLMLYTEDTYEVEGYPYFGYMRGRYRKGEIERIVAYGEKLGIEVIPCIQTLAHLEQFLKYTVAADFRDTKEILLVDEEKTYDFIEAEIKTVSEIFKSKRIHIGMDEAHDLGRGKFLDKFGYEETFDILTRHLKRVESICKKYDLRPMMWNDMFFRACNPDRVYANYRDADFTKRLGGNVPDVDMVYWDYYTLEAETYEGMIKKSKELGRNVAFAGGIYTWNNFLPVGATCEQCTPSALKSCINEGVREVIATIWGDDGNECNIRYALPHMACFSEYCYKGKECRESDIAEVSEFLTKMPYELTQALSKFTYRDDNGKDISGKPYIYTDILYGTGVYDDKCDEAIKVWKNSLAVTEKYEKLNIGIDLTYPKLVFEIICEKAEICNNLPKAYKTSDKAYLTNLLEEKLPELKEKYIKLKEVHKSEWYYTYKPFGFEVLSFRYGGIISRLDDASDTIEKYINGETTIIAELEEERISTQGQFAYARQFVTPSYVF